MNIGKIKLGVRDIIAGIALVGGIVVLTLGQPWGWLLISAVLAFYGIDLAPFIPIGRNK